MNAIDLDKRVLIQAPTIVKQSSGGSVKNWADVCRVWAAVKNLSGTEKSATKHGGQIDVAQTTIMIRHRAGIDATMRVVFEGKFYNITHANNIDQGNRWLQLTCDTGQNDG